MSDVFIGIYGRSSTIKQIIPIPHYYLVVLFIDKSAPDNWDAFEFVERWHSTRGELGRRLHWTLLGRPFFKPGIVCSKSTSRLFC